MPFPSRSGGFIVSSATFVQPLKVTIHEKGPPNNKPNHQLRVYYQREGEENTALPCVSRLSTHFSSVSRLDTFWVRLILALSHKFGSNFWPI